ncbi:MAG: vWA domain-containing protein [Spirochaetota bacterium]
MKPRKVCFAGPLAALLFLVLPSAGIQGQAAGLSLAPGDFRIEQRGDPGYHLFIRQLPGAASVLLAESTSDPAKKADNFAYRDPNFHAVNGNERRMLNGAFLPSGKGNYWLIDSSPEKDPELGMAFHIFIPWVVDWGYSWSRSGQTFISDGTFINVRIFSKPYADYSGAWQDNPYLIRVTQKPFPRPIARVPESPPPTTTTTTTTTTSTTTTTTTTTTSTTTTTTVPVPPPPEPPKPDLSLYLPETVETFTDIAKKGEVRYSDGGKDIVPKLESLLDHPKGKSLDLVFCLDTTDSMADDIAAVKKAIPEMLAKKIAPYTQFRVGLLLYKDYFEEYLVRRFDFTKDVAVFGGELAAVRVGGGRDIPEAVYEALYSALTEYPWTAEERKIVLIGDAPPHPIPRGKIDKAMVDQAAVDNHVELDVIILPP